MIRLRSQAGSDSGFTLIEVMVAAVVLVVGVLGVVTLVDGATRTTNATKARDGATAVARQFLEGARSVAYPHLDAPTLATALQQGGGLADDSAAAGWQVTRNAIAYTLVPAACTYDDARDGGGAHDGSYCEDSSGAGTADDNPDDYRRVGVTISWALSGRSYQIRQNAIVTNPGSAFAPSVKSLTMTAPTTAPPNPAVICASAVASATFEALTSVSPPVMLWSVGGVPDQDATHQSGSGSTRTWTWPLKPGGVPRLDGPYVISAAAVDAAGGSGTERALTVYLNRYAPAAPLDFAAGQNPLLPITGGPGAVELEWNRAPERDVAGYRVYRVVGAPDGAIPGDDVVVRDVDSGTSDTALTPLSSGQFYVRAYAPTSGPCASEGPPWEVGAPSAVIDVGLANLAPGAVTNLTAARSGQVVTLSWSPPGGTTPAGEAGDTIRYYRLYRNGYDYGRRLGHTGSATEVSVVDGNAGVAPNQYCVTAVDSHLRESTCTSLPAAL